ncbi:pilus (MSHA type) biogenesis protein MshL [Sulfuricurvum sp.]|uniref:pilus (MSHA type) biogenesis protein MshL n=1 Tax=Sulfuricurvum sp. TaxID=2025608 RepID=UPI00260A0DB6|nr:pilus (MSHA type) biogenesis protein MshL [Sulfuricurvum sp.]MDD3597271.1 pilus (MSHA type) biogenesis protein MshL [Sulfuricurvum sp.]
MTSVIKHHSRTFMLSVATAALLSTMPVQADCTYELFNISSVKGTTVGEFVDQLSDECGMSLIVTDEQAEEILKKPMNKTFLKNLTINEVLDLIIKENNLQYTLQNNVLKISYLTTKTYQIDYITTKRIGTGSTNVRLSSNTGTSAGGSVGSSGSSTSSSSGTSASSESGINISNVDEVNFWDTLEQEVKNILSRPEDDYRQKNTASVTNDKQNKDSSSADNDEFHNIIINKSAGLVTVTGTGNQIKRLDTYIADLEKKMQTQVLIDVKMYSVVFSDATSTGIDWSQLYALQNVDLGYNLFATRNLDTFTSDSTGSSNILSPISKVTLAPSGTLNTSILQVGAGGSLNELIKFLKTQGDVYSISNPKVLTLNNQPALITAGTELFYKTTNTSTLAGGTTGQQATTEVVSSVFSGVLLDITPEISNDGSITLRINPSISETASNISTDNATRTMPPDLSRRQLSSVITVKDGSRVIMGGLITTKNVNDNNKVPLLGDIPVLGYLFKREGISKKTEEIVIIIEPHIVKKEGDSLSLGDLGYTRLSKEIQEESKEETK